MDEIVHDWDGSNYEFKETSPGVYVYNKLIISPTEVSYKKWTYELDPDVYKKFLVFIELLKD